MVGLWLALPPYGRKVVGSIPGLGPFGSYVYIDTNNRNKGSIRL